MFDPENWQYLPPWMGGIVMAFTVSLLRAYIANNKTSLCHKLLEAATCGALTLSVGSAAQAAGLDPKYYLFIGGMVGGLGSQAVLSFVLSRANRFGSDKK